MSKKLTRRALLKLTAAGAASLIVASCGPTPTPTKVPPTATKAVAAPTATRVPPTATPAPQPYTFKFPSWMWGEAIVGDWFRARVKEFETQFPHIKVDMPQFATAEFEDKIVTQLAAGDAPDILPIFTNMLWRLIALNQLLPLDSYLDKSTVKANVLPSIKVSVVGGKTHGVPLTMSPQSLLYNQDLLDKAGIKKLPETPQEFFDQAKLVKDKTGAWGYAMPTKPADVLMSYILTMQWVIGFGSDWAKADGTITANDPKNKEALTWIQKFLDADLSTKGLDAPTNRNLFAEGKVGFMIDGPWVLMNVKAKNAELYKKVGYGISPTPTHAAITGGAFYTIPAGSKHKDDAWRLIEICHKPENQRRWLEDAVQIPGAVVTPTEAFLKEHPWVKNMVEVAAKYPAGLGYAPPGYEVYAAEFRKLVIDYVGQIWAGQKKIDQALDELQKALEEWAKTKKK